LALLAACRVVAANFSHIFYDDKCDRFRVVITTKKNTSADLGLCEKGQ